MVVCGVILSPAPGLLPDSQDWYSTTHFILQDVSSCSVVAVSWWCLLAQAGQPLRQHHPLARGGSASDRHPGVDHRLHWDQGDPPTLFVIVHFSENVFPTLVTVWCSCRDACDHVRAWRLTEPSTTQPARLSWGWAGPNSTNFTLTSCHIWEKPIIQSSYTQLGIYIFTERTHQPGYSHPHSALWSICWYRDQRAHPGNHAARYDIQIFIT